MTVRAGVVLPLLVSAICLVALVAADKGVRTFDEEGHDTTTVDKVDYMPYPEYISKVTEEGHLYKLRRRHDVLAVLVVQEYDCDQCAFAQEQFIMAANHVLEDGGALVPGVETQIGFATMDAVVMADEFSDIMDDNPDYHWMVPTIMVFKADWAKLKRPPVMFAINELVERDLPRFVLRLVGEDVQQVTSEKQLISRVASEATEGVSFGVWGTEVPGPLARIAERERMHVLFHWLPEPHSSANVNEERGRLISSFNPNKAAFVAYVYNNEVDGDAADSTNVHTFLKKIELKGIDFQKDSFEHLYSKLTDFIEEIKTKRPGHAYDRVHKLAFYDTHIPSHEECEERHRTKNGDVIVVDLTGKSLDTGTNFLSLADEELTVDGEPRADIPFVVMSRALRGLCPGMERDVVLPPGKAYKSPEEYPPSINNEHRLLVTVHMKYKVGDPKTSPAHNLNKDYEQRIKEEEELLSEEDRQNPEYQRAAVEEEEMPPEVDPTQNPPHDYNPDAGMDAAADMEEGVEMPEGDLE